MHPYLCTPLGRIDEAATSDAQLFRIAANVRRNARRIAAKGHSTPCIAFVLEGQVYASQLGGRAAREVDDKPELILGTYLADTPVQTILEDVRHWRALARRAVA